MLHEIWMAETRADAGRLRSVRRRPTGEVSEGRRVPGRRIDEALLAFYDFPAEHWVHMRTTNPIESSFATIRHRTDRTKGCVTLRATMLAFMFKLAIGAEKSCRRLRGFPHLAKVIAGVSFVDGVRKQPGSTQQSRRLINMSIHQI